MPELHSRFSALSRQQQQSTHGLLVQAADIKNIFGNMGFDIREQVALIGGGHAFGKVHGACPDGPGPGPLECPSDPYPGVCEVFEGEDRGTGNNTFTSGFEGAWTTQPTDWTNLYFQNLLRFRWEIAESPAGNEQCAPPPACLMIYAYYPV